MSIDTAVRFFRRRETALFRSECTLTRAAGEPVFTAITGTYAGASTTVYTGRCLVRPARSRGQEAEAGERGLHVGEYLAKLPADTAAARDDVLTITASPDAGLVGRTFRVERVLADDWQVTRRLALEEVVG